MTDAGPRYLPGAPIGYGMTPGVHHNVMTGRDDMTGDPEPVEPPPAPLLPGGPPPEKINLDAPEAQPGPAQPPTMRGKPIGWQILNDDGSVLAEFHNVNTADYQRKQVEAVGKALVDQAVTPDDKEAANRALAYGLAMVGTTPAADITKRMTQRYDTDERNSISRSIQEQKNKRRGVGGGGGPAGMVPGGPTKAGHKLDQDLYNRVDSIVKDTQGSEGYKALSSLEQTLDSMQSAMNSGNAMSERIAVQQQLLALTGKASRESEQAAITGAAGMWTGLANKLSLWTSDNPELTSGYKKSFLQMIAGQKQAIQAAKDRIGRQVAARVREESSGYPEEDQTQASDVAYGSITGIHAKQYVPPHERPAPLPTPGPAPAGGYHKADPDL